jgi:hypothetical protein
MATIIGDTYSKIPIFSDKGNLVLQRLKHSQSAAITNGDTVLLGKLPPFARPVFFVLDCTNLGSAVLDVYVGDTQIGDDVATDGLYVISNVEPSETGERDIKVVVGSANTGANVTIQLDIAYQVTQAV